MHKIRVYVDTSVFGGTQDDEFSGPSRNFLERVEAGDFVVLVSRVVVREISFAPKKVQNALTALGPGMVEYVEDSEEVESLANAYIAANVVGTASRDDATHVAAATVAGANVILSWNFKHIVNFDRIHKYNAVNLLNGYPPIDIRSPLEMTHADENENI